MWFTEYTAQEYESKPFGSLEINREIQAKEKPASLVLLKLLGVTGIMLIGACLILPIIPLPVWQSAAITITLLVLYVFAAHRLRPKPNTDHMGWCGGLMDDPFSFSDDWNRFLFGLNCFLGPGRFVSGTIIDLCTLAGMDMNVQAPEVKTSRDELEQAMERSKQRQRNTESRDRSRDMGGKVELDSMKYFNTNE